MAPLLLPRSSSLSSTIISHVSSAQPLSKRYYYYNQPSVAIIVIPIVIFFSISIICCCVRAHVVARRKTQDPVPVASPAWTRSPGSGPYVPPTRHVTTAGLSPAGLRDGIIRPANNRPPVNRRQTDGIDRPPAFEEVEAPPPAYISGNKHEMPDTSVDRSWVSHGDGGHNGHFGVTAFASESHGHSSTSHSHSHGGGGSGI